jgi:hypothetical protein
MSRPPHSPVEDRPGADDGAPPFVGYVASSSGTRRTNRRVKHVLLLGLDGAGKTRLATALAEPDSEEAAAARVPPTDLEIEMRCETNVDDSASKEEAADLRRPFVLRAVDDRLQAKKAESAPLGAANRASSGALRLDLMDTPGCAAYRALWPRLVVGSGGTYNAEDHDTIPTPAAVVFVISAHDPLRLHMAWTEVLRYAVPPFGSGFPQPPLLIVVARTQDEVGGQAMGVADVLKAVEDFAPIDRDPERHPWTVLGADLRPLRNVGAGNSPYNLTDLRRITQWLFQKVDP